MIRLYLSSPVGDISHIGKTVTAQLKHLGVLTVEDLLFYFPSRYDDLSKITAIKDVQVGQRVVVQGRIELIETTRSKYRHKLLTHAVVADGTGAVRAVWFNQPWITKMYKSGDELYLVGELKDDGSGTYFASPLYERATEKHAATHVARIVPVYPATEKLSQKQIRFLVQRALPVAREIRDYLPQEIITRYRLMALPRAASEVHFPANTVQLELARDRLKFDELLRLQLFALSLKRTLRNIPAPKVSFDEGATKQFVEHLPFTLTEAQRKAAWEILGDLSGREQLAVSSQPSAGRTYVRPMNRLLEGDVGSGKTVVVAIAALNAVLGCCPSPGLRPPSPSGRGEGEGCGQVAIMAPTGILARQHFQTFTKLLTPHGITVALRTGDEKKKKAAIEADVVVGTHALVQDSAQFRNLVLAVVDEQHRFGVSQRQALRDKREDGIMPHLLSLTATPIPRSLALVFYGDLDISILNEMPKGRQIIETRIVSNAPRPPLKLRGGDSPQTNRGVMNREDVYAFVRAEVAAGHQVFWTCPIIDPSDTLGVKAATEVFEHLKTEVFKDLRIGLLHGRMKSKEREKVMGEFASSPRHPDPEPREGEGSRDSSALPQNDKTHTIDILVATPVIEVGIDVPNATVMVIEGSERFGLAQLHQFRGRVGRGDAKSYCFLMVKESETINARLQAFLESTDGFALAEKDLALRGPGEVYGTTQSGFPEFKIASLADIEIAKKAREAAQWFLEHDPELSKYPELKGAVMAREGTAHLE